MLPRHPKEIAPILSSKVRVRPLPALERAEEGRKETGLQHVSSAGIPVKNRQIFDQAG